MYKTKSISFRKIKFIYLDLKKILFLRLGEWSVNNNMVVYPYARNNLTPRTHLEYLDAANEAQKKSIHGKNVSIHGIKGLSTLFQVNNFLYFLLNF